MLGVVYIGAHELNALLDEIGSPPPPGTCGSDLRHLLFSYLEDNWSSSSSSHSIELVQKLALSLQLLTFVDAPDLLLVDVHDIILQMLMPDIFDAAKQAITDDADRGVSTTIALGYTLSNILTYERFDENDPLYCPMITLTQQFVSELLVSELGNVILGEQAVNFTTDGFEASGTTAGGGECALLLLLLLLFLKLLLF